MYIFRLKTTVYGVKNNCERELKDCRGQNLLEVQHLEISNLVSKVGVLEFSIEGELVLWLAVRHLVHSKYIILEYICVRVDSFYFFKYFTGNNRISG